MIALYIVGAVLLLGVIGEIVRWRLRSGCGLRCERGSERRTCACLNPSQCPDPPQWWVDMQSAPRRRRRLDTAVEHEQRDRNRTTVARKRR